MAVFTLLSNYKTYVAAAGLVGLSVYQFSQGQVDTGLQTLLAALAAAGLRHEVAAQRGPAEARS